MSKTPRLPAPTDSWTGERSELAPTDLATDISRRTDRTSYSIPEDGSPVTLPTKKLHTSKEGVSQTSLLIEYFEIPGDQPGRPSVRVKVTPSSKRDPKVTADRKPSYTRRVSLTSSRQNVRSLPRLHDPSQGATTGKNNQSDLSEGSTFHQNYVQLTSDISSMPADSMIEAPSSFKEPERMSSFDQELLGSGHSIRTDVDKLTAPSRRRSRSLSKERITQKVLEKLAREQSPEEETKTHKARRRRPTSSNVDVTVDGSKPRSRKSSRSHRDDDHGSITESSLLHARDRESSISGVSKSSLNPRLLRTVEDVVRRLILPEIETIKRQQSVRESRPQRDSSGTESSYARMEDDRQSSKSTSVPHLKPKVFLNRDGNDHGQTLAGDSMRHRQNPRPSKEFSTSRSHTRAGSVDSIAQEKERHRTENEYTTAGIAGGALTAAALKSHDSRSITNSPERDKRERRNKRGKSHARSAAAITSELNEHDTRHEARHLPMDSEAVGSDLTRESILSAETIGTDSAIPSRRDETSARFREVFKSASRNNSEPALQGSPQAPPSTEEDQQSSQRVRSHNNLSATRSDRSLSSKTRKAALLAAGFGAGSSALYGHDNEYSLERKASPRSPDYEPRSISKRTNRNAIAPDSLDARQHSIGDYSTRRKKNSDQHEHGVKQFNEQSDAGQQLRGTGANAAIVSTPQPVESRVASLLDPSNVSSQSGQTDKYLGSNGDVFAGEIDQDRSTGLHESSSAERWAALRGHAHQRSVEGTGSNDIPEVPPTQITSIPGSEQSSDREIADVSVDREILDRVNRLSGENPEASILEGPLGDEHENRGQWPYEPTPPGQQRTRSAFSSNDYLEDPYMSAVVAEAATGLGIGDATTSPNASSFEARQRHDQSLLMSEAALSRDLYHGQNAMSGVRGNENDPFLNADSPLSFSKAPPRLFDGTQSGQFQRAGHDIDGKGTKHLSSDSHATRSPLYDAATGRGINNIQSKDVVALMDHLTVRDGHRNARDTEILVTLVRSAAEMRSSFDDMKKFVESQNQINMQRGDAANDRGVSKILNAANRTPHYGLTQATRSATATDDSPGKKKNLFQRALKGLSSRNTSDLNRMEDMLMQLLDEVESLKAFQEANGVTSRALKDLDSSEKLRSMPRPAFEASPQAAPSTLPVSEYLDTGSRARQLHESTDTNKGTGRTSRTRTAPRSDEDDTYYNHPDYDSIVTGTKTPTNGTSQQHNFDRNQPIDTQARSALSDLSPIIKDSAVRHKSGGSSLFGIPRISRWSKTTTSSVPITPNRQSQRHSEQSRFDFDTSGDLEEVAYSTMIEDHLRSTQSLGKEDEQLGRAASPLLPDSELSLEEAKYRANRHSLTLQHPQPRQGPNQNQRSLMETQARVYGTLTPDAQPMSPTSDAFGSAPSLGRFSRFGASQDYRPPTQSPSSSVGLGVDHVKNDDQPLTADRHTLYAHMQHAQEDAYSSDAHSEDFDDDEGQWIEPVPLPRKQSPYSPGGLLAPIEERYSLEHTRSSISATPAQGDRSETPLQAPRAAMGGSESPTARKITGPRDMPIRARAVSRT